MSSPNSSSADVPLRAWIVTFAGLAVNLCLGILYAWSVWKKALVAGAGRQAGEAMAGLNDGWRYLTDAEGTWAYFLCGLIFALVMIPGGWVQDRLGPRVGATAGGLCLAAGCFLAGWMQSYLGLILGFGVLGGIGMGLGYAAAAPAAVKWFGPHQRGLIVGLVVAGYGGAAIYIAPLAQYLIDAYGLSGSFYALGTLFAVVVVVAGQLLAPPEEGYVPPQPASAPPPPGAPSPTEPPAAAKPAAPDWTAGEMLGAWQYYLLVLLFIGSAQSGLLVIANASPILSDMAKQSEFFAQRGWILAAVGGIVNAVGRVGTGSYSDVLGRRNAYLLNGLLATIALLALPAIIASQNLYLLFAAICVVYWQYGGGLALLPAITADYFGQKNLGLNYGLVFLGWGIAFLVPLVAGYIKDATQNLDYAFYLSAGIAVVSLAASLVLRPAEK